MKMKIRQFTNLIVIVGFLMSISYSGKIKAQWNPHAGVIPSYTWNAKVITSSGGDGLQVIDHNEKSNWQSGAPLPNEFVKRGDQNVFFSAGANGKCRSSGCDNFNHPTDGDQKTSAQITGSREAWLEITLPDPLPLRSLSVKCVTKSPVYIFAYSENGDSNIITTLSGADSYKWKRVETKFSSVKKIKLLSSGSFQLFEVAAISSPLKEYVTLDLGAIKSISWIDTRHWAGGKATATEILGSTDNSMWFHIGDLDPKAVNTVTTFLTKPVNARYLKIQHTLMEADYAKVFVWEVNAWDAYGPFGKMPAAKKSNSTVGEIMGINGLWGWGYGMCSDRLEKGQGPQKFNAVATHARSYHNWHWDVTDPDNIPDYSKMAQSGTQALNWLDWDREYLAWHRAGLKVDASIQFDQKKIGQSSFDNPYEAAYNYAFAFADHFGSTNGYRLVQIMEAGNEPWDYPASFYSEVLKGFAKGAKAADPKMVVLPCALQSAFPYEETETGGNFSGARVPQEIAPFIDGLNVHHYSYASNEEGKRTGVHPEHPQSSMRAVLNDIRFRDANLPGKGIYVTEWGWDSDGAGETCTHSECVTEMEQALYAVRGAMMFIRLGVDKLNWFNYMNGSGGLYSRSGLVGSPKTNFEEKMSFRALQALFSKLGNRYFSGILREDDEAWIYQFGDSTGKVTHLTAWKPVDGEDTAISQVILAGYVPDSAWQISGITSEGELSRNFVSLNSDSKKMIVKVSAVPLVIKLAN